MGAINMTLSVSPNVTAYDSGNPTRSTELYCHTVHSILEDMDDSGYWYLGDDFMTAAGKTQLENYVFDLLEAVFDYAAQAIEDHRNEDPISIVKPTIAAPAPPAEVISKWGNEYQFKLWADAVKMMWKIYYMWASEDDPLLVKETIRELLIAWPLLENTIELNSDLGQQFKIYPSWKNADL